MRERNSKLEYDNRRHSITFSQYRELHQECIGTYEFKRMNYIEDESLYGKFREALEEEEEEEE